MMKARTIVSGLGALAMVMLVCGSVMGVVIVEDFESPDVIGTVPGPIWSTVPGWHDYSAGGAWTTPTVESAATYIGTGPNYSQVYYDPGYQGSSVTGAAKRWVFSTPANAPVEFTFEFDVAVRNAHVANPLRLALVGVQDDGSFGSWGPGVELNTSEVRTWDLAPNPAHNVLVGTELESAWQHIEIYVNTTTETMSVSLDGGAATELLAYGRNGNPLNAVWIQRSGGNPAWYLLDNLKVTTGPIPEPGTLALLGLGGAGLLRRRRTV